MISAHRYSHADRNWRVFLWFRVLFSARFYYPVMAVLFLDLGLTAAQFSFLNVVWAAVSLSTDIPAGVLADRLGRKPLLVFAGACMVLELAILCAAPYNGGKMLFLYCLANRILSGLAEGAASGADEAIVFDSLAENGREGEWNRVMEQLSRWHSIALVVVMLIGGAVYAPSFMNGVFSFLHISTQVDQRITLRIPLILSLLSAVGVLLLALCFCEPKRHHPQSLEDPEGHHATSSLGAYAFTLQAGRWLMGNPAALFVVCAGFLLDSSVRLFLTFSTSYFRLICIPEVAFGAIGAVAGSLGFFISPLARRMVEKQSLGWSFLIISALVLAGLIGIASHPRYWGIVFGFLMGASLALISFSVSTYLNQLVDSHHRATVLSFKGVTFNFAYGGISLFFAWALHIAPGSDATTQLGHAFGLLPWCFLAACAILCLAFRRSLKGLFSRRGLTGQFS